MMAGDHRLGAVSICTPPVGRHAIAAAAIDAGLHVMLEKPPAATTTEISALADHARARGVTLVATWHSREAAGEAGARDWLRDKRILAAHIRWKEDIRRWRSEEHTSELQTLMRISYAVFCLTQETNDI